MKELMAALKKRAAEKGGMLEEGEAKARMSALDELKGLMHEMLAKDLPPAKDQKLSAHIEAENPLDLKRGLEDAKAAIPAITERMKKDPLEIAGEEANANLEPDVNEEKDDDMMGKVAALEKYEDEMDDEEPLDDEKDDVSEDLASQADEHKGLAEALKKKRA